ncbi:MAG: GNAT family N-acetyltransferase [Acidimicrobiia bacterium]
MPRRSESQEHSEHSERSERSVELPTGYVVRHPGARDSGAIAEVVVAGDIADFGEPDFTEDDLLDDWARPRFALDHDAWVLSGPTGRIVGYAFVWEAQPGAEVEGDAFVLPEYSGRGLGTLLVELMENRACELAAGRSVTLGLFASHVNVGKRELLERRGFQPVHTVLRFKIDLANRSPEAVDPPAGILLRQFERADSDAVRDTMNEAFEGHRRYTPRRLDEWLDLRLRHPAFDPALWRVAECEGEVVGATLVYDVGDTGYLSNVGVRRAWRGKGVAQALVADAFAALRERGQMRVLVSVDADAAPAAVHLYEEAGMRVHERHDWFVKTLDQP